MSWISFASWYILIGLIFTLIYDLIQTYLVKRDELAFTNWERLMIVFGWPIIIFVSILKGSKRND